VITNRRVGRGPGRAARAGTGGSGGITRVSLRSARSYGGGALRRSVYFFHERMYGA